MKFIIPASLIAASVVFVADKASAADGKAVFDTNCAKCHGTDGKGATKMGQKVGVKDLTDPKVQAELSDAKIAKTVKEGVTVGDKPKMKAFPELSAEDIKAIAGYVKSLK